EHAVRRSQARRPRGAHHRRRPHRLRICVRRAPPLPARRPRRPRSRASMSPLFQPSLWPAYAAALLFGYLCGSIPFGLILTKFAGTGDIRSIGSGNIGATNVLRTGRKGLAAATLVGDLRKGTAAVLIAGMLWDRDAALLAGLGAFVGHVFPVWLRFKGG